MAYSSCFNHVMIGCKKSQPHALIFDFISFYCFGTKEASGHLAQVNIVFSVTSYLELCKAITIYCTSHLLPTKVKLVVWTL